MGTVFEASNTPGATALSYKRSVTNLVPMLAYVTVYVPAETRLAVGVVLNAPVVVRVVSAVTPSP